MDNLLRAITGYLDFLRQNQKLSLSVHFSKAALLTLPHAAWVSLAEYTSHQTPYCMAVKKNHHRACIQCQQETRRQCLPNRGFCRSCHAGVLEYLYPICKEQEIIGYIAVSGYRTEQPPQLPFDRELWRSTLSCQPVPLPLCEALAPPLGVLLEDLFSRYACDAQDEYTLILQYLQEYHSTVTLGQLCAYFNRSESHISHLFKQRSGVSIREYCNRLKLEDAKVLLLTTDLPVTQIALDVGFQDTSYFVSLFRKKYGLPPLKFRRSHG